MKHHNRVDRQIDGSYNSSHIGQAVSIGTLAPEAPSRSPFIRNPGNNAVVTTIRESK